MNNLVEKLTCKDCKEIEYKEIEILNKQPIKISGKNLNAIIVKKFKCEKCSSNKVNRRYVKRKKKQVA